MKWYAQVVYGVIVGIFIGLFLYSQLAQAEDWSKSDKIVFGTYIVASAIDAAQTINAMDQRWPNGQRKYKEANPILGDDPSDKKVIGTKLVAAGLIWVLSDRFPKARTNILWAATAIQVGVVAHNYSIGIKMGF